MKYNKTLSSTLDLNILSLISYCFVYPVNLDCFLLLQPHLENGDKIIMPPSALDRLSTFRIDYPMLFNISNPAAERVSHCGVMEFTAEEGAVYLPQWMMENMHLLEGGIVYVKSSSLKKGTYVKLQPHTKDFLVISNPKVILEIALRNFSCLTVGDTIMVPYNDKKFYIDILDAKPSREVTIIETDCEVDFAPPLDYVERPKPTPSIPLGKAATKEEIVEEKPKFTAFTGVTRRLDGKLMESSKPASPPSFDYVEPKKVTPCLCNEEPTKEEPKFIAFRGVARRLDGLVVECAQPASTPGQVDTESNSSAHKSQGKLISGSDGTQASKVTPKVAPKETRSEPEKKEEQKFQAFTGKKYLLTG
ncbi:hypothetical protein GIB67_034030 [Kingdonia uniflora]|uniref:Ubiquitin fusion degradaton protein n=1 Tax=Kingdonia uniflora TaxID=39325 RepID=A0A7J7M606_9MAGN|nr:hypothetical protein GIB67_034030 [Kingdonia uniflora]